MRWGWPQRLEHYASRSFLKGSRVIVWDGERWIGGEVVECNPRGRCCYPYFLVRVDEQITEYPSCEFDVFCDNVSHAHLKYMYESVPKQGEDPAEWDDMPDYEPIEQIQTHQESYNSGFELFFSSSSSAIRYEHENPEPDEIFSDTYWRELIPQERKYLQRSFKKRYG
ncbi:hypothetical protein GF386_04795 [Candidatus Pacearchaeota archaeon]|nr:hypothetical protein [Candidatus Pacearchaeota archaeon]